MPHVVAGTSEPVLREMLRVLFTRERFDLDVCTDGDDVLALARTSQPDAVVLGSVLAGPSPYDVCRGLKAAPTPPYCVLLTAEGQTVDRTNAVDAGFDDFEFIPFSPTLLVSTLRRGIGRRA